MSFTPIKDGHTKLSRSSSDFRSWKFKIVSCMIWLFFRPRPPRTDVVQLSRLPSVFYFIIAITFIYTVNNKWDKGSLPCTIFVCSKSTQIKMVDRTTRTRTTDQRPSVVAEGKIEKKNTNYDFEFKGVSSEFHSVCSTEVIFLSDRFLYLKFWHGRCSNK